MASSSGFAAVLRQWRASRSSVLLSRTQRHAFPFTLGESPIRLFSLSTSDNGLDEDQASQHGGDLRSRIFRLRFPKRSATAALDRWAEEGRKVTAPELRDITRELRRAQRYKHALEILMWMQCTRNLRLLASDHALYLELILVNHGVAEAEAYFEKLQDSISKKAACLPLLRHYIKVKNVGRAEDFMLKLQNLGLLVTPDPFNEIMKLYLAGGECEKVPLVIEQMKESRVPLNVLSYNLWLNACGKISSVSQVEKVYQEIASLRTLNVGWSTHATMGNIYIKHGMCHKAYIAVRCAEETLSAKNRLGYFFLITLYANLHDRDSVLRVWESSKKVPGRITCANFMCILLSLVKVGDINEAERVFERWEQNCRKYDVRVSNVLLGAYVRKGWMNKAEVFHEHSQRKGGVPNYKTWEILMEGWIKYRQMDKAVVCMKKGFSLLKHCNWRPSHGMILSIAEYFESNAMVADVMEYVKVLRVLDIINLPVYKSFLRTHIRAQKPFPDVLKMMEKDKVVPDKEILQLIQSLYDNTRTDKI